MHNPPANRGQQEATSEPQTEFHCAISECESFINLRKQRKVFQLLTDTVTHSLTYPLTHSLRGPEYISPDSRASGQEISRI